MRFPFARKVVVPVLWILLGAVVFLAVAVILRLRLAPNHPLNVVRRWEIAEQSVGTLVILLLPEKKMVEIKRDPDTSALRSIEVCSAEAGAMFRYQVAGQFGMPEATYNGGPIDSGMGWRDLNTDGRFDQRWDLAAREMQILVSGNWVKAIRQDQIAKTSEGYFKFDPQTGHWRPVVSRMEK